MDVLVTVTVRACATCKELLESKRRKKDADKERLALYKWRVEVKLRAIKASARARNRKLSRQTPLLFDDASKALFIEQLNSHCWFCGYKPARPCKVRGTGRVSCCLPTAPC